MMLSPDERRLIDEAIAAGRVTQCPRGASALHEEQQWCPKAKRLVAKDLIGLSPGQRASAHRQRIAKRVGKDMHAAAQTKTAARGVTEEVAARREMIAPMIDAGKTAGEIAQATGLSLHIVRNDAAAMGKKIAHEPRVSGLRPETIAMRERLRAMHERGMSQQEMADAEGRCRQHINTHLREMGIFTRGRAASTPREGAQ